MTRAQIALLLGMLSCVHTAHAQEPRALPNEIDLATLLSLVDRRSPALRAERASVAVARADVVQAGVHPNPELEYQGWFTVAGSQDAWNGLQNTWTIGQPLLLFDQIGVRTRAAQARVAASQARLGDFRFQLEVEARRGFIALLAAEERVHAVEDAVSELERLTELVRARAQAGDRSRYDALRVELELRRLAVLREQAEAAVTQASGQLATLIGEPSWQPRARGDLRTRPARLLAAARPDAVEQSPRVRALSREATAARAAIDSAQRDAIPVPTVGAGGGFTTNAQSQAIFVGLTIPLPVFDQNQGNIARAEADADYAGRRYEAARRTTRAELVNARRVLSARQRALDRFERDVLRTLPELRQMAEQSYRGGQTTVLELVDSIRALRDVSLQQVNLLEGVRQAEVDVLTAAGLADRPSR